MDKIELPSGALDVLLKEHALLRDEIKERLKTAFSHVGYAGAIAAFAIPAADKMSRDWVPNWLALAAAGIALFALCWVALLNMRWVQHAGAYLRYVESRVAQHFGEPVIMWEHYGETVKASMWGLIPSPAPHGCIPEVGVELPRCPQPKASTERGRPAGGA